MLTRLKENRLKLVSALCVTGDVLMGLAGAAGLYHIGRNPADLLLTAGSGIGLLGHAIIFLWGKGGKAGGEQVRAAAAPPPIYLRPLLPWRYPLDAGFALWAIAALPYIASGLISSNPILSLCGMIWLTSALFGWLWPQGRKFYGLQSLQVCAIFYQLSGLSAFLSGLWAHSTFMIAAGCCYTFANFIFYTVRKENQSKFTIEQGQEAP
jgi:hypothetical protein